MAIENFDKIPICAACTYFVDLLGMDSYALRVEIESANFILQNMNRCEYDQFDSDETLTEFIGEIFSSGTSASLVPSVTPSEGIFCISKKSSMPRSQA